MNVYRGTGNPSAVLFYESGNLTGLCMCINSPACFQSALVILLLKHHEDQPHKVLTPHIALVNQKLTPVTQCKNTAPT